MGILIKNGTIVTAGDTYLADLLLEDEIITLLGKISDDSFRICSFRNVLNKRGLDITTEAYPYTAASTGIDAAIFDGDWQGKLGISYGDIQWQDTGERLTAETFERYRGSGGVVIMHMMKEEWIERAIRTPWVMVASDGMPYAPGAHPRTAGTYARVLGRYVRERGVLDLPAAIRKMTLLPARRLEPVSPQMARKGATFEDELSFSEGILHVLVRGVPVVLDGELVPDAYPGKAIRGDY